jgi:uncharacterized OB-fold protein
MEIQRCEDCASFTFYPRALCPSCGSRALRWAPVSGRGRIYSLTIVHRPTNAAFKSETPYVVALIDLEEGCRMMSNVIGVQADPDQVKIGMPVEVVYERVTDDTVLPKFRPASS